MRVGWGKKRQILKNVLLLIALCSVVLLVLTFYNNECYYLNLELLSDTEQSAAAAAAACGVETVKSRLNATFITFNYNYSGTIRSNNKKEKPKVPTPTFPFDLENSSQSLRLTVARRKLKSEESITEFPLAQIFEERKSEAEAACVEMLNLAMVRESTLTSATGDHTTNLQFSVGYTRPPTKEVPFYNKNMLQLMKLRQPGLNNNQHARFFQSAGSAKRNRWIYFHRIVPPLSPDGTGKSSPKNNEVVEFKWCPIFKAASTPWLAVFTKLSKALTNRTEGQIKHGKLGFMELAKMYRLLTPRIYDKMIHPIKYKMVVVRHPFKRLLSAYRDKIERVKGRHYYYNKYSTKIIARFRKYQTASPEWRRPKDTTLKNSSLKIPTFHEFVRYVLSTELKKLDEHWRPIFLDCNPCHQNFDFILKVETLNRDKDEIMKYLHVFPHDPLYREVEDVWVRWNNPSGTNQPRRNDSFYFSQLTIEEMDKLYNLYEPDFKIFNYSPDSYFLMAKDYNIT